jgi:hypothetical protein
MRLKSPIDYFFSQNKNKGFSDTFYFRLSDSCGFGFKKFNSLYIDLPNRGNLIIGENVNDECKYEILSISLNLGFTNESNILCANSASFWLLANIS